MLIDFGVKTDNYCSDMTRTLFFGKATTKFKKMYTTVFNAQQKAIEYINNLPAGKAGQSSIANSQLLTSSVDRAARDYIISQGYPSIPHSLGHGIGLQVHESPRLSPSSKEILSLNSVFSIEPGIYIPNLGGVRIEDLCVLTKKGVVLISHSKKGIIEI